MIQLNIKIEIFLYIFESIWDLYVAIIMKANQYNSVFNIAINTTSSFFYESQHTGPLYIFIMWVDDQIKTNPEEWTPTVNCSNFLVCSYFSPNFKTVIMEVLPW